MEEETEIAAADWQLPLAFSKSRHTEAIEGVTAITQTWRMKERVMIMLMMLNCLTKRGLVPRFCIITFISAVFALLIDSDSLPINCFCVGLVISFLFINPVVRFSLLARISFGTPSYLFIFVHLA